MEMKTLNLDAVKEIRDLARKNDRNYFNFVSELEKILKTQKPGEWSMRPIYESGNTIDEVWEQNLDGHVVLSIIKLYIHFHVCMFLIRMLL